MSNLLKKICIVCEGYEDYYYFEALKRCKKFHEHYKVIPKNAKSIDKVFGLYQNIFQLGDYDLVLVFCDTEMVPYEQFERLLNNIDDFHAKQVSSDIVYFANPCTMQIMLSHFGKVKLTTNDKIANASKVQTLTGVKNYKGQQGQIQSIVKKINLNNYSTMKNNLAGINTNYQLVPSTNFISLLNFLEQSNTIWVDNLIQKII